MVLFSSLSTSQITSLSWTQSNVTISGTSLTGSGSGNAYDAVGFAPLPALTTGKTGYYATIDFSGEQGYAYVGLSQSMTTTDPVEQNASKIDAGFKCNGVYVLLVLDGVEIMGAGTSSDTYQVVFDGTQYIYFVNGMHVLRADAPADNGNGYRVAAAFRDGMSAVVTAGTYDGQPIMFPPSQVQDLEVDIGIPGEMTVTWNPPSYNGGGISYYKVGYISVDDPYIPIDEVTIAANLERSHTFTNVSANEEYAVTVIAFNNTEQSGPTASVSLTTPGWLSPTEVRNLVVTSTQQNTIDITWDSPVSTGLSSETFTKYRIFFLNIAGVDINILVDHEAGKTTGYTYSIPDQYSGIYVLQIAAINGADIEGNVAARAVQVESEPPLPVTNIAADNSVPGKLTVTWEIDQTPPVASRFMVIATDSLGNQVPIIVENTNSAELTLNAETYSIEVTAITGLGGTASSNGPAGVVVAPDSGGGGGGGGGGNNGGNGYNNMATLEYNYPSWAADVTQTNTITVLGEDSADITADETIVINVPLAKLKECIVYESQWTTSDDGAGDQPLPKVEFRPSETYAAKSELDAMFAQLKALGTGTVGNRTFTDDASATHDQFGKILINDVTFTGSVFDSQDLPKVAIRSVEEGAITVDNVTTTVATRNTADHAGHKVYLEGLFEQLVAADRIKKDDATSDNNAAFGPCKMPTLQAGDSLSFLVTYTFSKTREYEVDGLDAGNGNNASKALTLTIGGSTFTINTGAADGSETSEDLVKTYAFKMVATA
jgi:hypothetical protein